MPALAACENKTSNAPGSRGDTHSLTHTHIHTHRMRQAVVQPTFSGDTMRIEQRTEKECHPL